MYPLFAMSRVAPLVTAWLRDIIIHTRPARLRVYDASGVDRKGIAFDEPSSQTSPARLRAFVCSGLPPAPGTPWMNRAEVERWVWSPLLGAMEGCTMFAIPYLLRSRGSSHGELGVEVTDSPELAEVLYGMAQVDRAPIERFGTQVDFCKGLHVTAGRHACAPFFVHLPQERTTLSIGVSAPETCRLIAESHCLGLAHSFEHRAVTLAV